jgi:type II secretion system protein I
VRRTVPGQAGFTLLEVLVALAVMSLAVVTLFQLISQSLRLVKTSGDYQEAVLLANRIATETQPSEEAMESGQEEFQPKETTPGREPAKLFAVTIDVRWGQNHVVELATLRTPTSTPATGSQPATGNQPVTGSGVQQPITPSTRQPRRSLSPGTGGS